MSESFPRWGLKHVHLEARNIFGIILCGAETAQVVCREKSDAGVLWKA